LVSPSLALAEATEATLGINGIHALGRLGAHDVFSDAAIAAVRSRLAPCRTIRIANAVRMGAGARAAAFVRYRQ
jgi:hypothetical protein